MAKILLAEDDEALGKFLAGALKRAGHVVDLVADGIAAIEALERQDFDLLVTDIVMPGKDGMEVAKQAAKLQPGIKIMFITGFAAVSLGQGGDAAPQNAGVLSKPFHLRDLVEQIDEAIAA